MPETIDGYARLVAGIRKDDLDGSFFSVGLYCRESAFYSVIDVFYRGITSAQNNLRLSAHLIHPDHFGQKNYWDTEWIADTWQVAFWEASDSFAIDGYIVQ